MIKKLRVIPQFTDYFASRDGRIFSTISDKYLTPWSNGDGYLKVSVLNSDSHKVKMYVHRLILFAFSGLPPEGMECCHFDGNPKNNSIENLRWGTQSDNVQDYRRKHGKYWSADFTPEKVKQIRNEYTGKHGCQKFLAEKYGANRDVISDIVNYVTYKEITNDRNRN